MMRHGNGRNEILQRQWPQRNPATATAATQRTKTKATTTHTHHMIMIINDPAMAATKSLRPRPLPQ